MKETALSYFELQPRSRLDGKRPRGEEITAVLKGELFFTLGHRTVGVKEGEVMAIPPNMRYRAFTRHKLVKALVARSPVR